MEDKLNKSGVLTIVESDSSIIIRTKQFQGTAFSGVFERRDSVWTRLTRFSVDELLSTGACSYFFNMSAGLYVFRPGHDSLPRSLPGFGNVSWLRHWSGDTVIARTELPGQDTASFVLIADTGIVRTISSVHISARYRGAAMLTWEDAPLMAYVRDGIAALIAPETGSSLPLTFDPSTPMVTCMIEDSGTLWCGESSHGLYQVDTSTQVRRVPTGWLDYGTQYFTTRGTFWRHATAIVRIDDDVDSLMKTVVPGIGMIDAMEFMEDGRLLVAADSGFLLLDPITENATPFTMNGWPKYRQLDTERYCGVGFIARFGSVVYAFATRPVRVPAGDETVGGLFRLDGDVWSRCDDFQFGMSTVFRMWRRTNSGLVISSTLGVTGPALLGGKLVRYDVKKDAATLITDDESATYDGVTSIAANDSVMLWVSDNSLWIRKDESTAGRIDGMPSIGAVGIVGSYAFLWYKDSSVVRMPLDYLLSSTSVPSNGLEPWPKPKVFPSVVRTGDNVHLSWSGQAILSASVELVSMEGVVQSIPVAPAAGGSTLTFQVPHVSSGMYMVILEDPVTGYRTSAKLLVR